MTEIPEHLLARSRARREAIGQAEGGGARRRRPPPSAAVERASEAAAAPRPVPAASPPPHRPRHRPAPPPPPEKPKRPEVVAAESPQEDPVWAMPVLAALPVWAFLYASTLEAARRSRPRRSPSARRCTTPTAAPAATGRAAAAGTVFPGFTAGEVALTFPDFDDQLAWIQSGSAGRPSAPTAATATPTAPGGQRTRQLASAA